MEREAAVTNHRCVKVKRQELFYKIRNSSLFAKRLVLEFSNHKLIGGHHPGQVRSVVIQISVVRHKIQNIFSDLQLFFCTLPAASVSGALGLLQRVFPHLVDVTPLLSAALVKRIDEALRSCDLLLRVLATGTM